MKRSVIGITLCALALGLGCNSSRSVDSDKAIIRLSPTELHFSANSGGPNPVQQVVAVTNGGGGTLTYSVSHQATWLEVVTLGSAPDSIYASAYVGALTSGEWYDTIVVTANERATNSPQRIPVRLTVFGAIGASSDLFWFSMVAGGPVPEPETLIINNNGGGPLDFTLTDTSDWLAISKTAGSAPDTILIGLDTVDLLAGLYGSDLLIVSPQANNSPLPIACSLRVISWLEQHADNTFNFRGVTFLDELNGFVVGFIPNAPDRVGVIFRTQDGGDSWDWVANYSGTALGGIDFGDALHGCAVGDSGTVVTTSNGGTTWSKQPDIDTTWMLWKVDMLDQYTGYAVGKSGLIVKTVDGGAHWSPQTSPVSTSLADLQFFDTEEGFAVGNNAVILHTTDGGDTWDTVPSGIGASLWGISFADHEHGWVTGDSGRILVTVNGGANWTPQSSGSSIEFRSIHFSDQNNGWVVGPGGTVLSTTNGGGNWSEQESGTSAWLFDVSFVNNHRGWVVGDSGIVITTFSGGR